VSLQAVQGVEKWGPSNVSGKVKKVKNKGKDKVCKYRVVKSRVRDHTPAIPFQQFLITVFNLHWLHQE